jgi:ubiquinone/menaquinone biosynthesis C-methylase UbiE
MNKQNFLNFEGDNFFKRNIDNINKNDDIIINNINKITNLKKFTDLNILEIGFSNGWRLNELTKIFPNNIYFGIDPSEETIHFGEQNFNNIKFNKTTCDDMSFYENEKFDVILISFVFMYIDRNLLIKSIFEIDRILKIMVH